MIQFVVVGGKLAVRHIAVFRATNNGRDILESRSRAPKQKRFPFAREAAFSCSVTWTFAGCTKVLTKRAEKYSIAKPTRVYCMVLMNWSA